MSDAMFFLSIRDKKVNHTEMKFLSLGSTMVWSGLILLFISGAAIFGSNPEYYMASSKFIAKMTIVLIITINGLLFRFYHVPHLHRHAGKTLSSSRSFMKKSSLLLVSGSISICSWTFALVLGALRSVSYSVEHILLIYMLVLAACSLLAIMLKPWIFKKS